MCFILDQSIEKYNSFPLKNMKILIPTLPSLSARAYFWCFNLQQQTRFENLQQLFQICSNFILVAATLF